jgi:hypothetical protein
MTLLVCRELLTRFVVPYMTHREVHTITCIYDKKEPETETVPRTKTTVPTWLSEVYDTSVCNLYLACRTGDAQFVTDFATEGVPVEVQGKLFNIACYKGHLEVVKALDKKLQTGAYFANVIMCRKSSFSHACIRGHLHVAQWLCSRFGEDLTTAGWLWIIAIPSGVHRIMTDIAMEALKRGHDHVAKWLLRTFPSNRNQRQVHFITVCKYGNVQFATWLRDTFPVLVGLDYDPFIRDLLAEVCANGHLIVLVRLKEWGLLPETTNYDVARAFSFACGENRLHVASWLMETYNISAKDFDREYAVYDMYVDLKQSGVDTMASWLALTFPKDIY